MAAGLNSLNPNENVSVTSQDHPPPHGQFIRAQANKSNRLAASLSASQNHPPPHGQYIRGQANKSNRLAASLSASKNHPPPHGQYIRAQANKSNRLAASLSAQCTHADFIHPDFMQNSEFSLNSRNV